MMNYFTRINSGLSVCWALIVSISLCLLSAESLSQTELPYIDCPHTEKRDSIELTIRQGLDKSVKLSIHAPAVDRAKVFWLDAPERVIIDLPFDSEESYGQAPDWYRRISFAPGLVAQGLRIGSHETKVRFVIDLLIPAQGAYQVRRQGEMLEVLVGSKSTFKDFRESKSGTEEVTPIPSVAEPTPTVTSASSVTFTPTLSPTPIARFTIAPTIKSPLSPTMTTAVIETAFVEPVNPAPTIEAVELNPEDIDKPHASRVALTALGFEVGLKGERGLKIKFSKAVSYQLMRRSKELYVLLVDDVELAAPELALPHFPPQNYPGFVSVRAQQRNHQVQIYIYMKAGVNLLSIPFGSEVWLRTIK